MKKQTEVKTFTSTLTCLTLALSASFVFAHGTDAHNKLKADAPISSDEHEFGRQGDPKKAVRTISVDMTDNMRFNPSEISLKAGETVRFVVANKGVMMHEMVIGTMDELKTHGEMMRKHPGMEHDEPYMAHVSPGRKEDLVWQFTKAGDFYFACLVPGHFEAGMVGKIKVTRG